MSSTDDLNAYWEHTCTGPHGAILILRSPGHLQEFCDTQHIRGVISRKWAEWYDLAEDCLSENDPRQPILCFVRGWIKTAPTWTTAVFSRPDDSSMPASRMSTMGPRLNFPRPEDASNRFSYRIAEYEPPNARSFNDCVFVKCYYAKRRSEYGSVTKLEAGAGPHRLPDSRDPPARHGSSAQAGSNLQHDCSDSPTYVKVPAIIYFGMNILTILRYSMTKYRSKNC